MPKSDRVWNLRLNLDEFNSLIASVFTDGDRALLLQGLSLGCNGGPLPDGVPPAFMRGWMFGNSSRDEAEEFKARQSAKGKISAEARKEKSGTAQPVKPVSNSGSESVRTTVQTAPEAILNPQSYNNNPQTTNDNPSPIAPQGARRTKFIPPTEEEWVDYCREVWPEWSPTCSAESWAYYAGVGWRLKAGPIRDWKATARTAHGNARSWGHLQPTQQGQQAYLPATNNNGEILATGHTTAHADETLEHWKKRILDFHKTNPEIVMSKITYEEKKMLGLA